MKKRVLAGCILALLLAGCGGPDQAVEQARHKLHSTAATALLVLDAERSGRVSSQFATEHIRDARKNLEDVRQDLEEINTADANVLVQKTADLDQVLKDIAANQASDAATTRDTAPLQRLESELREEQR